MANYSLVVNSKFQPFSFERYIQPYQLYGLAYKEQEDAYADLADSAEEWGSKIDPSQKAYNKYREFMDSLEKQADVLAKQGLNPSSRQQMLKIRSRYSKEINPIKVAYERGKELGDEQRKLYIADPTLRFDKDFSVSHIDDLIDNPNMSYAALSGRDIAARASAMYGQYAKAIMQDPDLSRKILGNQKYLMMQQQGYTPEQILADIMGRGDAPPELKAIRESIHKSLEKHGAYDRDWVDQYISQGAHSGIGTRIFTPIDNGEYIDAARRASLANESARLQLAQNEFNAKYEKDDKGGFRPRANNPYLLPDGRILDNKGYVINPDRTVAGKYDGKGGIVGEAFSKEQGLEMLKAEPIEFTRNYFSHTLSGKDGEFDWNDAKIRSFNSFNENNRAKIRAKLAELNLTPGDVDIYADTDWYNDNHYIIVPKGYNPSIKEVKTSETSEGSNTSEPSETSEGSNTSEPSDTLNFK